MKLNELIRSIVARATSTNQAAQKAKMSQSTLSEWCSGKVNPGLEKYINLCRALGCRPGWELDQFLGLGAAKPTTAEDVLGSALSLDVAEQQRLISLISLKYAEYLKVHEMVEAKCLIELITKYLATKNISPEQFIKKSGLSEAQYLNIMHGLLAGSFDDIQSQLTLLASLLINPCTSMAFSSRDELIEYCQSRKSPDNCEHEPSDIGRH